MTKAQIAFINNAKNSNQYSGKRFLGFTEKGAEVWISLHIEKDTLKTTISTTHNLDSLRNQNAVLASKRVTLKKVLRIDTLHKFNASTKEEYGWSCNTINS